MNIPAGKIIIGLLVVTVIVLGVGLYQAGQGTTPSPPTPSPEATPTPAPSPTPTPTPTPEPTPPEEAEPPLPPAEAATEVGGIISNDTTWTKENSPYVVTSTIQIPEGVTLTIEPGVTISMPSKGEMFLLHGTISALGTTNNKIVFDGGDNSDVFTTLGGAGNADLDYCIIRNGHRFWDGGGYFNLTHSELANLTMGSEKPISGACIGLESPSTDCYIEYNRFINTGGIWSYQGGGGDTITIYIRYNLFQETSSPIHNAGVNRNVMIVKYNSFVDIDGIILSLEKDSGTTITNATGNYWGTLDTDVIDQKIHDRNDDIRVKNYIEYLPILTEPYPSTPTP